MIGFVIINIRTTAAAIRTIDTNTIIPIMLPIAETNGLYRLIVLMPLYYSQYISIMSVEQIGNGMLYAIWAVPVAVILMILGSIISRRKFIKHQVYS